MKKLLSLILIAGTCTFIACGPSKEEQAKAAKATADSLAQVEAAVKKATEDSMAMVQKAMQDSITAAANMKAMQDSMDAMKTKMNKASSKPKASAKTDEGTGTGTKSLDQMIKDAAAKKKQK